VRYIITGFLCLTAVSTGGTIGFNRDVRPILSKNCFPCHGPDAHHGRKGELRLDLREDALKGGESGKPAIVPGKPDESSLMGRIHSKDPDVLMPPPESHLELRDSDRDVLRRWIEEGAEYEGHWAFQAPKKAPLPEVADAGDHPIDRFIGARLAAEKLSFSPEADPLVLIRRVTFDLTGLPPSPEEIAAFQQALAERPATAYSELVDRLLASPRFGEQMAVRWLDASRYADTNGYSIDGGRHQWLWRDWVIKAYNDNKPYHTFITEQLAGDLLPGATEQQIVATGFNRNHAITHEGGTIPEENIVNYVADRVKTTSEAILGLTMACAQCHDHKYDPISLRDYYRFFAFFNTLGDAPHAGDGGRNAAPTIDAMSCFADPTEAAAIQEQIARLRQEFELPMPEAQARHEAAWRADLATRGRDFKTYPLEVVAATSPNGNPDRIRIEPDLSVSIGGGDYAAYNVLCRLPTAQGPLRGLRVVFHPTDAAKGKLGFSGAGGLEGNFVLNTLTTSTSSFPAGNVDLNAQLPMVRFSASSAQPGHWPEEIAGTATNGGWAPLTGSTTPQHITVTFAEPVDPAVTPYLTTELMFNFGSNASPARFQVQAFTGHDDGSPHPDEVTAILAADPATLTPEQQARLKAHFQAHAPEKALIRHQIANLEERHAVLTRKHSVLVMDTSPKPRVTHILDRGLYSSPMEAVTPGTPEALPPLAEPADRPLNRLDLANWMTRADHPLTARVAVNTLWESFFGKGIAASSADFGSQAEWPSHPELLDWLAVHFVETGWDMKQMIRGIVTSRTYRQSSNTSAELLELDPRNDLLARGPRLRLSAEQIRDQALATSGLLVERLGGPSVRIYQPGDLWRQISHFGSSPATSQTFIQDHGEKLYRRSLYTYWKRTLPPVNLAIFDAPNREVCAIGRSATNTPLQALVLLNDPQFVEAARAFAQQLLQTSYPDDSARLAAAFSRMTGRPATAAEQAALQKALVRERQRYQADPAAAGSLLAIGESPRDPALPAPEHAAWTQVASLVLNLSETVTKH
jgi:hypothetical protein